MCKGGCATGGVSKTQNPSSPEKLSIYIHFSGEVSDLDSFLKSHLTKHLFDAYSKGLIKAEINNRVHHIAVSIEDSDLIQQIAGQNTPCG